MKLMLAGIFVTLSTVCSIKETDAGPIIQDDIADSSIKGIYSL